MNKFLMTLLCMSLLSIANCHEISERGYWIGNASDWHYTDWELAQELGRFWELEQVQTLVDFGCGAGEYVDYFLKQGLHCEGYDGNPHTPELTQGRCAVIDLSEPFDLRKRYDWVLSIEVGEHLPHQFERIYIENLMRHAKNGIVISWALKNQGGTGHFNEQNNDYIKALFAEYGYINDLQAEERLRSGASFGWFKNTLMVFRAPL